MEYHNIIITKDAEEDLERFVRYLIVEKKNANSSLLDEYCKRLYKKNENIIKEEYADKVDITSHNLMINETIQGLLDKLTDTFKNGTIND